MSTYVRSSTYPIPLMLIGVIELTPCIMNYERTDI